MGDRAMGRSRRANAPGCDQDTEFPSGSTVSGQSEVAVDRLSYHLLL